MTKTLADVPLQLGARKYQSRLLIGSGGYKTYQLVAQCAQAAGADIVTVAMQRTRLGSKAGLTRALDSKQYTYLPNSAGCTTAAQAVRCLRLARAAGGWRLVKLEIIGDDATLYPNMPETLKAAEQLIADGFEVMAYCTDDLIFGQALADMGCAAVMPLAAPIGSGLGIQNPFSIALMVQRLRVPVLVDAGIGSALDAAQAMELGCAGVLVNSAIAKARHPVAMARAMRHAVLAGRLSYLAGRMQRRGYAQASSPMPRHIRASKQAKPTMRKPD